MDMTPYGLLNPLSIPANSWEAVGIDFVGPLPSSKDQNSEYDSITVIIDLLTAMVHLVLSRDDYTAKDVAELMFVEVYKHHGLPRVIISDCDVLFTSTFWTRLNQCENENVECLPSGDRWVYQVCKSNLYQKC